MFGMLGAVQNTLIIALGGFVSLIMLLAFFAPSIFMRNRLVVSLWGKFESTDEIKKFSFLAFIFFLIVGTYWGLRPVKDSIFGAMVGLKAYQPFAKILSLIMIVPLIIFYNKLIDRYPRRKLFYILFTVYGLLALLFMAVFLHPTLGLANTVASPYRIFGWLWYVYVESFGSLMIGALFWAFTTDITLPESAKRGFPLIYLFGQMGNILGPKLLRATNFGFANSAPVVGILAVLMLSIVFFMWLFLRVTPESQLKAYEGEVIEKEEKKKEKEGFLDGLKHLLKHKYLLGIAGIIIFFEIIVTILDYNFKALAQDFFTVGGVLMEKNLGAYLASYGVWTGIVSTLCVLFGINSIQRKLGMRVSLVLMPLVVLIAVLVLRLNPILAVAFWIMVFSKAVNYALNQPTLKQAYIPTTKESKYKAQSWIEMFGGRSSKATGSAINVVNGFSPAFYVVLSTVVSLGLIGVWVLIAIFVAKTYTQAIKENKVVC